MKETSSVDVWFGKLCVPGTVYRGFWQTLAPWEQRCAHRLANGPRQRFVISRGMVRAVLSHYLQMPPAQLSITCDHDGKPILHDSTTIKFSVTHTNRIILVAVGTHSSLGIDVEEVQNFPGIMRFAKRFLHSSEYETLARSSSQVRVQEFFRIWTFKEAFAKASGLDMTSILAHSLLTQLADIAEGSIYAGDWICKWLDFLPGHAAALVVKAPLTMMRLHPLAPRVVGQRIWLQWRPPAGIEMANKKIAQAAS